jgi:hypothetical protein
MPPEAMPLRLVLLWLGKSHQTQLLELLHAAPLDHLSQGLPVAELAQADPLPHKVSEALEPPQIADAAPQCLLQQHLVALWMLYQLHYFE